MKKINILLSIILLSPFLLLSNVTQTAFAEWKNFTTEGKWDPSYVAYDFKDITEEGNLTMDKRKFIPKRSGTNIILNCQIK